MTRPDDDLARPYHLWASGFTRRWHMNAALSRVDDLVCAHQGRCAVLVMALFPWHSLALLRAAVTHDAAEFVVGDLSAPFKKRGGGLVGDHAEIEAEMLAGMGLAQVLDATQIRYLKLVDRIDSCLFVDLYAPHEARRNGWPELKNWCVQEAFNLECGNAVSGLFWDSEAGAHEEALT